MVAAALTVFLFLNFARDPPVGDLLTAIGKGELTPDEGNQSVL